MPVTGPVGHHNGFCDRGKRVVALYSGSFSPHCAVMPRQNSAARDSGGDIAQHPRGAIFARALRFARPRNQRAQGMPDAGRTREPCVQRKVHFAHASNNRAAETVRHSPRNGVNAYTCSPWCAGLVGHHRLPIIAGRLDPSVGGSGPHDFAVREIAAFVERTTRVHRIPVSRLVTIGRTPLLARRDGGNEALFLVFVNRNFCA
jgi:hypothetical protein